MLVLTRKSGEAIRIGEEIIITLVEIKGHQVRIGIEAPNAVPIYREEVFQTVKEENVLSADTPSNALDNIKELLRR